MDDSDEQRCAAEITDLHRTIQAWLTGAATAFAEFADAHAHADGFTMVTPDGQLLEREPLLAGFRSARGSMPGLTIEIRSVRLLTSSADVVAAGYEEWQTGPGGRTGRRSTVLFDRDLAARHHLRSRHLHETWLPGD